MTTHTLAELFDAYLAETKLQQEPYTHYMQSRFLRTVLHAWGPVSLAEVTPDLLRTWKLGLSQRYKPSTTWRYLMYAQCVLDYGLSDSNGEILTVKELSCPSDAVV